MIRLKDIAANAGVDVSTVSRALSGDTEINAGTREEIRKLAAQMGYRQKLQQVRSGKIPGLVGVILPEARSGYYSAMLDTVDARLRADGKTSLMGIADFDVKLAMQYITGFARAGAEGIIYIMDACETPLNARIERQLRSCGIPVVIIAGNSQQELEFDSVFIDEFLGIRKVIGHLAEMGHKSIGYIGETRTEGRRKACRAVLREKGLEPRPEFFRSGEERLEEGGYLRMKELLSSAIRPTAVFVAYDQMAVGAIRALKEADCEVPREMSVVGFDDISAAEYVLGGLTTVATPMEDAAAVAIRLLLDRVDAPQNHAVQHVTIQPSLVVRSSTAQRGS